MQKQKANVKANSPTGALETARRKRPTSTAPLISWLTTRGGACWPTPETVSSKRSPLSIEARRLSAIDHLLAMLGRRVLGKPTSGSNALKALWQWHAQARESVSKTPHLSAEARRHASERLRKVAHALRRAESLTR